MSLVATQRILVRRSVRGLWPHLPLLMAGSVAVCLSACVAALVAPGATPLSVLLLAVLVTPAATAIGAVANAVVGQDDAGLADWRLGWAAGVRHGIAAVIPVAIAGALFVVAVEVWRRSGQPLLLASIGVSGAVTACLVPVTAAMVQLTTGVPAADRRTQWRMAAGFVARWPVRFLAAPVLLGFGAWLAIQVSASVLLLVPAPVALVSAAAFWTSAVETGLLSIDETTENDVLERESA